MLQRTSPPTLFFLASLEDMTPLEVETIETPKPLITLEKES